MESLIQYQKDFETSNCLCTKTKGERIIACFADRDEAIVDEIGMAYDDETGAIEIEELY